MISDVISSLSTKTEISESSSVLSLCEMSERQMIDCKVSIAYLACSPATRKITSFPASPVLKSVMVTSGSDNSES